MRIGLISDTHGDPLAWRKAVRLLEGCRMILHAGDHLYNGAFNPVLPSYSPSELARLMNESKAPILHVRGNCDSEVDQLALKDPILSPYIWVHLDGLDIMVVHGHQAEEGELARQAAGYGARWLVRGHTHIYGIREVEGVTVCNPGSPSLPKGDGIPTVGLLEGNVLSILELESGKPLLLKELEF